MSGLDPIRYPSASDVFYLGGVPSPGIIVPVGGISGAGIGYAWDVKRGKGAQGAAYNYTGREPPPFTIKIQLWRVPGVTSEPTSGIDDFAAWDAFAPYLKYDPIKTPALAAVDIFHPWLDDLEIHSVLSQGFGPLEAKGGGLYIVEIKFVHYLPAPAANATSTPNGSTSQEPDVRKKADPPPAPLTPEQLLAQLQAQAAQP